MSDARDLPQRSTRGKRMRAMIDEEEENADNDFWNQEFFAEEARDEEYNTESESEDVPDSDFDESESEDDDDSDADEPQEKRRKALKPPGAPPVARKPAIKKPTPAAEASDEDRDDEDASEGAAPRPPATKRVRLPSPLAMEAAYEAPSLRRSTKIRSEEAEFNRSLREQLKPRRRSAAADARVLTQEELLAEAARTEVENLASLKLLLAREEETKRRAAVIRKRYAGPATKWRSFAAAAPGDERQMQQQEAAAEADRPSEASTKPLPARTEDGEPMQSREPAHGDNQHADPPGGGQGGGDGDGAVVPGIRPTDEDDGIVAPASVSDAPSCEAAEAGAAAGQGVSPPGPARLEQSYMQPINCKVLPRWLKPRQAKPQPPRPLCAITGAPARYCDPLTRQYFSTSEAFRELRRRAGHPKQMAPGAAGPDAATPARVADHLGAGGVLFAQPPVDSQALDDERELLSEDVMALVLQFAQQ